MKQARCEVADVEVARGESARSTVTLLKSVACLGQSSARRHERSQRDVEAQREDETPRWVYIARNYMFHRLAFSAVSEPERRFAEVRRLRTSGLARDNGLSNQAGRRAEAGAEP